MDITEITKTYAITCHRETNHTYDGKPYEIHLQMVADTAEQFIHLIPKEERATVLAGCWVHDCMEDCRQTYNDVMRATNQAVAELAYALTNEKGKNRAERANAAYYEGIRNTRHAAFIKCCDRIANASYSKTGGKSRMFEIYQKENASFEEKIYHSDYEEAFQYLRSLFA